MRGRWERDSGRWPGGQGWGWCRCWVNWGGGGRGGERASGVVTVLG